jgi:thioredoxin reductase
MQKESLHIDYLIVGGGPAGLQLGYFLQQRGRDYLILEAGEGVGTFFKKFPTHRKLISANKVYTGYTDPVRNLRWDWNSLINERDPLLFKSFSKEYFPNADKLVSYLEAFAEKYALNIRYLSRVVKVSRSGLFRVTLDNGVEITANKLIMATGVSKSYVPDVPGAELADLYSDASVNPDDYEDKRVLVVGKGNSAFETADNLIATASRIYVCSPTPITLSWKSKYVGHLRAVNNNFVDTYQLKLQNVMLDAHIKKIEKGVNGTLLVTFHYTHADDEIEVMEFDKVILCTGFKFDSSIFDDSCKPTLAIKNRFPAQTSSFESQNIRDLYFAGTIMQERDFKKKQSGFIHGFRHNIESLSHILESRYHQRPWPAKVLEADSAALAKAVLDRANRSPGIWQQTGFIGDVITRSPNGNEFYYYEEVPVQYIHDQLMKGSDEYFVVTLEFGLEIIYASPDPLAVNRIHKDDVEGANLSTGIHPIVKKYSNGELKDEHHVLEDIIPEWTESEVHVLPLEQFFERSLFNVDSHMYATTSEGVSAGSMI